MLHDDRVRAEIGARLERLTPDSPRQWGRMTIGQMLWHLNQALLEALGQLRTTPRPLPLLFIVKPIAFNLPWPRGARTAPEFTATSEHDFAGERSRCLRLVDDFARRDLGAPWARHSAFGPLTGPEWSRFMYRHLDHHLRQFGA